MKFPWYIENTKKKYWASFHLTILQNRFPVKLSHQFRFPPLTRFSVCAGKLTPHNYGIADTNVQKCHISLYAVRCRNAPHISHNECRDISVAQWPVVAPLAVWPTNKSIHFNYWTTASGKLCEYLRLINAATGNKMSAVAVGAETCSQGNVWQFLKPLIYFLFLALKT